MDHEEYLRKQIQNLNRHLPKGRASLAKLLKQDKPGVEIKDGSTHRFKKKELEYLADILPEEKYSRLKLPIIIRISPELGRGASKVTGKVEREVFRKILDKEEGDSNEMVIYRPEMRAIRKKLPTTTQYAFMISPKRR